MRSVITLNPRQVLSTTWEPLIGWNGRRMNPLLIIRMVGGAEYRVQHNPKHGPDAVAMLRTINEANSGRRNA